jgi:hypothetical protein
MVIALDMLFNGLSGGSRALKGGRLGGMDVRAAAVCTIKHTLMHNMGT